ncbi:Aldo/keto reductase [Mycena rebaudengoi]|nr:Aldo/keto reductase [Mycena rebaudengoi]
MGLNLDSTLKLNDGNEIPLLGFGTYEMAEEEAYNGVTWALKAGYRHIDSATWYENEKNATGTPRSAIYYTTKLKLNTSYEATLKAIQFSIDECGLGYLDFIGVSNFGIRHLKDILDLGLAVPSVNQIDLHPFMARSEIAWAPLVRGMRFTHPVLLRIAKKYSKTTAHVLLRYSLQKNYIAIPKSVSEARIISNTEIFDFALEDQEVAELMVWMKLVTDWDPTDCP